jgi:FtsH-binding integral membrane protein
LGRVSTLTVLLTGALGALCAGVLIAAQEQPSSLNWPLLAVPLVALLAVFAGSKAIRGTGAAVMCGWCCLGSLGLFLSPCAVAMIAAARETR